MYKEVEVTVYSKGKMVVDGTYWSKGTTPAELRVHAKKQAMKDSGIFRDQDHELTMDVKIKHVRTKLIPQHSYNPQD